MSPEPGEPVSESLTPEQQQKELREIRKKILTLLFSNGELNSWSPDHVSKEELKEQFGIGGMAVTNTVIKVFDVVDLQFDKIALSYHHPKSLERTMAAPFLEVVAEIFLYSTLHNDLRIYTVNKERTSAGGKKAKMALRRYDSHMEDEIHDAVIYAGQPDSDVMQEKIAWFAKLLDLANVDAYGLEDQVFGQDDKSKDIAMLNKCLDEVVVV